MANELSNRRIAFLTANEDVERVELTEPWNAVEAAGGEPVLVALEAGTVQTFDHLDPSETFERDGGGPGRRCRRLRRPRLAGRGGQPRSGPHERCRREVRQCVLPSRQAGRRDLPRALDARGGRRPEGPVVDELAERANRHRERTWVDEEVVVCDQGPNVLVSSRKPDDLPAFTAQMVASFSA